MALLKIATILVLTTFANANVFTYQEGMCYGDHTTEKFQENLRIINETFFNVSSSKRIDFYNIKINAKNPTDTAYGLFMCRGDTAYELCSKCIRKATHHLFSKECSRNSTKGVIWYDMCLVRYSDSSLSMFELDPYIWTVHDDIFDHNVSNPDTYMYLVYQLLNLTVEEAVANSSLDYSKKFALKEANNISCLVQCTNNLSPNDCQNFLHQFIRTIKMWAAYGRDNVVGYNPNCIVAFGLSPLFSHHNNITLRTSNDGKFTDQKKHEVGKKTIAIIVSLALFAVMFLIFCYYYKRRRSNEKKLAILKENSANELKVLSSIQFTAAEIIEATNNFAPENYLGSGGYANVYKGVLPDDSEIAVKKLKNTSKEGNLELQREILTLAKLQHKNLVTLLGFCLDGKQKMLIYEYLPNKTLYHHLFDPHKQRLLSWTQRFEIIKGIVRGLLYLHQDSRLRVIHRDLKPSNILLDYDFQPKIADFGLARIVGIGCEQQTNKPLGTRGYMAPESNNQELTTSLDVYSLGIILLEIVSGEHILRSATIEDLILRNKARKALSENFHIELLESEIRSRVSPSECNQVKQCIDIALLCIQEDPVERPSMGEVVSILEINSDPQTRPTELPISNINPNNEQQDVWSMATYSISEVEPR